MQNASNAPAIFKSGEMFLVEASMAGLRDALGTHHHVSATTDEAASMFSTPWTDGDTTHTELKRSKLCTYTQGERDSVRTKSGVVHLRDYQFQLKVTGADSSH